MLFKNRFLSLFSLCFAASLAVCFIAGREGRAVSVFWCGLLAIAAAGCFAYACRKKQELKTALFYILLISLGLFCGSGWLQLRETGYDKYQAYTDLEDTVFGTVIESGASSTSRCLDVRVERSKQALPRGTVVRFSGRDGSAVHIGDRVELSVTYRHVATENQRGADVDLTCNGSILRVIKQKGVIGTVRNSVLHSCETLYEPYGASGITQALTVRERTSLDGSLSFDYRNAGLAHLLAISGLHLSLLVLALRRFLGLFRMHKKIADALALVLLLFYCLLTGFSPSIVRASVMLCMVLAGTFTLHRTDPITSLFLALLLLLLWNPYALLSLSLQLSFLSCLGILVLSPILENAKWQALEDRHDKHRALRAFVIDRSETVMTSVSALVFTFPVLLFSFGAISWISPLTNLILLPLFTPLLVSVFVSVLICPLSQTLAKVIAFLPGNAFRLIHFLLRLLSEHGIGSVDAPVTKMLLPLGISVCTVGSFLLFRRPTLKRTLILFGAFSLSLALSILWV